MAQRLRIGFVGAGGNTRNRHLPGFKAVDGIDLAVVANRSEASSRAVADEFGIARIAPDWRAVVEDPQVDAVCIGTWPYLHAEVSIAALEAGKHVLTEARMARNVEEAQAMLDVSRAHPDLVAQVVPSPFTFAYDATVRDLVAGGSLGELREITCVHTTPAVIDPEAPLTWRQSYERSGNNILSLGINHEAVMRWVDGSLESLTADGVVFTPQRADAETGKTADVEIPDRISVHARYTSGVHLAYHVSGIEPAPMAQHELRVHGSEASLRVDVLGKRLLMTRRGESEEREVAIEPAKRGAWRVEADFVDSIRDGKPVELTSFATGLEYMQFTDAVRESWTAGGERVDLG